MSMRRENHDLPPIKDLLKASDPIVIEPGTIWLLPVYYLLEFPPHILKYEDSETNSIYASKEIKLERTNSFWFSDKKYFNPNKNKSPEKKLWIALETKIRPFLVIQKPNVLEEAEKNSYINWQGNSIAGFPITSLSHLEKEDVKIDPKTLEKDSSLYPYHYFINNDSFTNLKAKSYIAITTLTRIHKSYFTRLLGKLPEGKTKEIVEKIKNYI